MGLGLAILGASIISGGASLIAGSKSASESKQAGRLAAAGTAQAREDLTPFREAGVGALEELNALLGLGGDQEAALNSLRSSPGFQFRFNQGVNALENSAAASGGLFSGNTGQALTEFGQNFASNEFGSRVNRLLSLVQGGQSAAAGQGAASIQGGNALAQGALGAGQAQTSATIGVGNAATSGIQNALLLKLLGK